MSKYDKKDHDRIEPIIFYDMNCCPKCGSPSLVMLDHEFDMTGIDKDGHINEVLACNKNTEIACTKCGFRTINFILDDQARVKICTDAELIYEVEEKQRRIKDRIKNFKPYVGLKSKDDNPFMGIEVTYF